MSKQAGRAAMKAQRRQIELNKLARNGAGEYTGKRRAFTIDANGVVAFK